MTLQRIASVGLWMVITSAVAVGQQPERATDQTPRTPATRTIERTHPSGGLMPSRLTQKRMASDSRETVIEAIDMPGPDGTLQRMQETTTDTIRTGPNATRSTRDLVGVGAERQRTLLQRTASDHNASADGSSRTVATTWVADPDGRLDLRSREIDETRSFGPDHRESTTTRLLPGINEPLRESERTESSERRVNAAIVRHENVERVRDLNGRWQSTETRTAESRQVGATERVEEEKIMRPDLNGHLTLTERTTIRRSTTNGRDDVVSETYTPDAEGFARSDARFALSRRVRTATTVTADGGSRTIEEVEERNLVAPADPMRVIRRAEITVRRIGPDRWSTERRIFERDVNGRMVPSITEVEESTGR